MKGIRKHCLGILQAQYKLTNTEGNNISLLKEMLLSIPKEMLLSIPKGILLSIPKGILLSIPKGILLSILSHGKSALYAT